MNGFLAHENFATVRDILPWLQQAIAHFYPNSTYAKSGSEEIRQRGSQRLFEKPCQGATVICPHCGAPNASPMDELFILVAAIAEALSSRSPPADTMVIRRHSFMQPRTILTAILSGALLWIPAVLRAQSPGGMPMGTVPDRRPVVQDNGAAMPSGPAKVDDKKFVKDAGISGLIEVELGKLAADKGSSDAVKQFGQRVVETQTKTNEQLKDVAAKAGYSVLESLDTKHHARVDKLAKLSGAEFDKAYIKDQVKENQTDVRAFQEESEGGTNAVVKAFAANTLPTLQAQLAMAKDLRKSGGASPGDSSK